MYEAPWEVYLRLFLSLNGDPHSNPEAMDRLMEIGPEAIESKRWELEQKGHDVDAMIAAHNKAAEKSRLSKARVEQCEEELLQATANKAEADEETSVAVAEVMMDLDSWPEEKWADLPPEAQEKFRGLLADWREHKEEWLGGLPIETRRELERKFGKSAE